MKKQILYNIGVMGMACLLAACSQEEPMRNAGMPEAPEGRKAVTFTLAGMIAEPMNGFAEGSRAEGGDSETEAALATTPIINLPDGTTLWLFAEDTELEEDDKDKVAPKAYVVRDISGGQQLRPCEVDADGNVTQELFTPLYLLYGHTYRFRAVSPAREFDIENPYGFYVDNKEYVIATDDRYEKTAATEETIKDDGGTGVQVIPMKPLLNQTSQLEFTIVPDEDNKYIHSISVLPQGIEISGVQDRYCSPEVTDERNEEHIHWNWSTGEPLQAFTGGNNTRFLIRKDEQYMDAFITENKDGSLYIKCPILPTNAFSTSIIVVFNLQINGSPTQYQMMLNQKIYKAAYTYHYKGTVSIQGGVSVITWQYVNWSTDAPVIPRE